MNDPHKSGIAAKSLRHSNAASDATSNGEVHTAEEGSDRTKLLEEVEAWDYSTLSGTQSVVPAQYQHTTGYGEDHKANLIAASRSTAAAKRGSNISHDWDAMSTEEQVRRRFNFRPHAKRGLADLAECQECGVARSPMALLHSLLPLSRQLSTYTVEKFTRDFAAGATMATVMVPQGLVFASIAGTPLLYGLYIVWVPCFVYGLMDVSVFVSYGPFTLTGIYMVDVFSQRGYEPCPGLCRDADEGIEAYLEGCAIVTFLIGVWYVLLATLKLGEPLALLLADPVIDGFVMASVILVCDAQWFMLFQSKPAKSGSTILATLRQMWYTPESINWVATSLTVGTIVLCLLFRWFNTRLKKAGVKSFFIPETLLVIVIFTIISWSGDLSEKYGVDVVGTVPAGLPLPKIPRLDKLSFQELEDMAMVALIGAIMGFIITHSIGKNLAGATELRATPHLVACGAASLVGSVFMSLPCAASFSRGAVLTELEARTAMHNVFTFILMTLVLLYLGPLLECLPTSVLAGTNYAVLYKFFDFREPLWLLRVGYVDLFMWVATFAVTLVLGVKQGMVAGMAVSALTLVQRSCTTPVAILGRLPGTNLYRDVKTYPDSERIQGVEIMRLGAPLTFANKELFRRAVLELVERSDTQRLLSMREGRPMEPPLQYVVLDCSSIYDADSSALRMLEALVPLISEREYPVEILIAHGPESFMQQLHKSTKLSATLGRHCFLGIAQAVQYASDCASSGTSLIIPRKDAKYSNGTGQRDSEMGGLNGAK